MSLVDKTVITSSDQTLECIVSDVTHPVTFQWFDKDGEEITTDSTNYTIDTENAASNGVQQSTLSITAAKLSLMKSMSHQHIFSCSVLSGEFSEDSDISSTTAIMTLLTFSIEAQHVEVAVNQSESISCIVNGITKSVDQIDWKDASGNILNNNTNFEINCTMSTITCILHPYTKRFNR